MATGSEIDHRKTIAIHEAAHAIVAYHYGWHVNEKGIDIQDHQYTGLQCLMVAPESRDDPLYEGMNYFTEEARVCISQAGLLAELLWPGNADAQRRSDEDLRSCIESMDWRDSDWGNGSGDDHDAFFALIESRPDAAEDELIAAYREYETKTTALLKQPAVWRAVEALADVLWEKGKMKAGEVEYVLVEAGFDPDLGAGRRPQQDTP